MPHVKRRHIKAFQKVLLETEKLNVCSPVTALINMGDTRSSIENPSSMSMYQAEDI